MKNKALKRNEEFEKWLKAAEENIGTGDMSKWFEINAWFGTNFWKISDRDMARIVNNKYESIRMLAAYQVKNLKRKFVRKLIFDEHPGVKEVVLTDVAEELSAKEIDDVIKNGNAETKRILALNSYALNKKQILELMEDEVAKQYATLTMLNILGREGIKKLLKDENVEVRKNLTSRNEILLDGDVEMLAQDKNPNVRIAAINNCMMRIPYDVVEKLIKDKNKKVRLAVASNCHSLDSKHLKMLLADKDKEVREATDKIIKRYKLK